MKWVFLEETVHASPNARVRLGTDKLKHLRKVLRMEWDEPIRVIDGAGRLFEGWLEKQGETGGVRLGGLVRAEATPAALELVVCLPKNTTMDWIVEKAVECGVTAIFPVISSRSVVRPDLDDSGKYVRRWQAIMDGALEQCERLWRPLIGRPNSWNELVACHDPRTHGFVFVSELRAEMSEAQALSECWEKLKTAALGPVRAVIGPEGGFSDQERAELRAAGFSELSLGNAVLRVETAVISALTLLRVRRTLTIMDGYGQKH